MKRRRIGERMINEEEKDGKKMINKEEKDGRKDDQ